jgi:hypothetical protein
MKWGGGQTRDRRAGEVALTGESTLLLIIASAIVILCGWLAWRYSVSTEDEARAYAARTLDRLAFAHDANYLAANLSQLAPPGYPVRQQKFVIGSLTKLGVPVTPIKLKGTMTFGSAPDDQDPKGHFESHVIYPAADARLYLDVTRHNGVWRIDLFSFGWQDKPAQVSVPSS